MTPAALIVDDDSAFRDMAALLFAARGCSPVYGAAGRSDALATFLRRRPEWVLIDLHLDGSNGVTLAQALSRQTEPPRIVLTSTDANVLLPGHVAACGAIAFVAKDRLATADLDALFSRAEN